MKLLEKYLFATFSSSFFPIFLTLYLTTSIIFLVKIAALTAGIQMNFLELMQFYSYSMPRILFYTMTISFVVGLAISISKLSSENELIVITSFGTNPMKILRTFLFTTITLTLVLLILSLGLIPKANYLRDAFLNIKKQEAQFNIKASEYGQQIGSWLVYVDKEKEQKFQNITLLQLEEGKDTLISANHGNIDNFKDSLNLNLRDGKSFVISDNIQQVDFEKMILNHTTSQPKNIKSLNDIIMYWQNREPNDFIFRILVSFFPLLSLFFVITIGYFNPRYETNRTIALSSSLVLIFIILARKLTDVNPMLTLYILPSSWLIIGYIYYCFKIKRIY